MMAPSSPGDVLDRLTILDLKVRRIRDRARSQIAATNRDALLKAWYQAGFPDPTSIPEHAALCDVNRALWDVEDALRHHEAEGSFNEEFVRHARSVYTLNDQRARLKADIDRRLGADYPDVKSYDRRGHGGDDVA
jgi:hypothetical protein